MNSTELMQHECQFYVILGGRQEKPSLFVRVCLILNIIINIFTFPFTTVLNALVIIAVKTKRRLRAHKSNIAIALLATSDFVAGSFAQPTFIAWEKTKKLFLPSPPLSPSITLTPTPQVAVSTLPSLTNKNNPLFWVKHAQKPKLASTHSFVRGCSHLMLGNQCLGTGTKWCCVHTLSTRYLTVYIVTLFRPIRLHFETCA